MKISIVDIGSNAVKYKIFNSENFELLEYYREPLRLGRDVFTNNKLSEISIIAEKILIFNEGELSAEPLLSLILSCDLIRKPERFFKAQQASQLWQSPLHLMKISGKKSLSWLLS